MPLFPAMPYSPSLALTLAQASLGAYAAIEGRPIPRLPGYGPPMILWGLPDTKIGTAIARVKAWVRRVLLLKLIIKNLARIAGLFLPVVPWRYLGYESIGLVYISTTKIIIAVRGTDTSDDVVLDLKACQVKLPAPWLGQSSPLPKVHGGFLQRTLDVKQQLLDLLPKRSEEDHGPEIYVTGHSLGGAAAILAGAMLRTDPAFQYSRVEIYTYAAPRVGNGPFRRWFRNQNIPCFRVMNHADIIPQLPLQQLPTCLPRCLRLRYRHVGEAWSFLNQTNDLRGNHALAGPRNYIDAVSAKVPTNAPWGYPISPNKPPLVPS